MQQIQGIETLQHVASSLGGLCRYGDTYMVHAAEGETVIPLEVLDRDPLLKERLFDSMRALGIDPERYIVGNELNSRNPLTGQPEFFFKSIKKLLKSPVAQVLAGMFLPGGPLIPMGMEAIAGGEMKDIFHAGVRGSGGRLGADFFSMDSPFRGSGSTDWWAGLKDKMWKSPVEGKSWDISQQLNALKEGELLAAAQGETQGSAAWKLIVEGHMNNAQAAFLKANPAIKGGFLNQMGEKIMADPLQSLFVAGMGYGQYDEAKRFNEALKQQQQEDEEHDYIPNYDVIDDILNTTTPITYPNPVVPVAKGGIMNSLATGGFPRQTGQISGPGTGTSDDIPAMLSDGEFVMTADAVRGAGNGSRSAGTKKMYDMMRRFEGGRA